MKAKHSFPEVDNNYFPLVACLLPVILNSPSHVTRSTTGPGRKGLKERHLEGFGGDFHCTSRLVFQFRSYSQGGNGSDSLCPSQSLLEASLNKFTECGRSRIWTQFLTKLEEKKEMYQAERKSKFRLSTDLQK